MLIQDTNNGDILTLADCLAEDVTNPTVELSSTTTTLTGTDPFTVTATFSEDVTGFDDVANDVTVTNGTVTSITGGPSVYTLTIQPSGVGDVTITVPEGAARDQPGPFQETGNPNTASNTLVIVNQIVEIIQDAFESLSHNFIAQRVNLLASNGPRLAWLSNRVEGDCGGGTNGFDVAGENGNVTGNFAFNSSGVQNALDGDRVVPTADAPSCNGSANSSGVNTWIEGRFAYYDDDRKDADATGDFFVGYAGIDFEVMDRVSIGIMGEVDWMNEDGDDNANVEGTGWMIGPYLTAEIAEGVFLDMRAMGGRSDNSIRQAVLGIDYDGDFDTQRWLAEATLSGNYEFDTVTLTPDVRLLHIRENQDDYTVSGGGNTVDIDGNEVMLTQLSSGLRISHSIEIETMTVRPYAAGRLFWNIDNPGEQTLDGKYISTDDLQGAVTLGLDAGSDAMQFGIEGTYDGLFGDEDYAIGGRVSFGYSF